MYLWFWAWTACWWCASLGGGCWLALRGHTSPLSGGGIPGTRNILYCSSHLKHRYYSCWAEFGRGSRFLHHLPMRYVNTVRYVPIESMEPSTLLSLIFFPTWLDQPLPGSAKYFDTGIVEIAFRVCVWMPTSIWSQVEIFAPVSLADVWIQQASENNCCLWTCIPNFGQWADTRMSVVTLYSVRTCVRHYSCNWLE